jgi:hypothetical protein
VIKMNEQIESLKSNVIGKFESNAIQFKDSKKNLNNKEGDKCKIDKIPLQERQFRVIADNKSKEELYLYLLQKRRDCH